MPRLGEQRACASWPSHAATRVPRERRRRRARSRTWAWSRLQDPLRPSAARRVRDARAAGLARPDPDRRPPGDRARDRRQRWTSAASDVRARVTPAEKLRHRRGAAGGGRGRRGHGRRGQRRSRAAARRRRRRDGPVGNRDGPRGSRHRAHRRRLRHDRGRDPRGPADRRQHPQVRRVPALGEPRRGACSSQSRCSPASARR